MSGSKWISAFLVGVVTAVGIMAPTHAMAQSTMQPMQTQSTMQSMQPEASEAEPPRAGTAAKVGAGFVNVVYVPGKAIICGAGTLVAGGLLLLTFGNAYREAVSFFNEGCAGSWIVTPEQVARVPNKSQFEY